MTIEQLLYWAAYVIPFALIVITATAEKIVEKKAWHWKHFYRGLDLMVTVLGASLVNLLDVSKMADADKRMMAAIWTVAFVVASFSLVFVITSLHQDWGAEDRFGRGQVLLLGFASNGVGIALAWGFVQLKVKGLV